MLSIRSMIERFRETKPTSRQDREQARKQNKELLSPMRDEEGPTGETVRPNSLKGGRRRFADRRQEKSIRWADIEPRPLAKEDADTDNPSLSVEKLMSQDIQRLIATGSERTNLCPKPPRVAPSMAPMCQKQRRVMEGFHSRSLVLPWDRERAPRRDSMQTTHGEKHFQLYLRDSLALDPNVYTGTAELRGGPPTSSQQHGKPGMENQQLDLVPNENVVGVNVLSAADVTADLDGVLKQLRHGMTHGQHLDPPAQLSPRENPAVNLTQIAHDLDAKLLEFTLMAKARERVADEAHLAAEAEKNTWRERETKRVEDEVRREHAVLHNSATRQDSMAKGLSGAFDLVSSRGYVSDWDSLSLRNLSTRHPTLPPSALGGCTSHFPTRVDAPVEDITNQMAAVLRAVETKVRRIEALEFDWSREKADKESQSPKCGRVEQANSPACATEDEDEREDDTKGDNMKEANADENQTPLISAPERSELAAELDGALAIEGGKQFETNTAYDKLPGCQLFPREFPILPHAVHQSWLNGHTTLQQAGQCIGAELEVTMLCMQKRLGKQPITHGEKVVTATEVNQDDPAESAVARPTEESDEKVANATEAGARSEGSFQQNLLALADGMDARREQKTDTEVDRELGLVFRNDPDFKWRDHDSSTDDRHLHYGGRAQDDGEILNPGAVVDDKSFPTSPSYLSPTEHAIWGVPAGEPPLLHTQVLGEKDIEGWRVPPVLAPGEDAIAPPAPPILERHPVRQYKANRSHLLAGSDMFAGQSARIGGLRELEDNQQRSTGVHQHRYDEDRSGVAVARARHRLNSFRRARQIVLTNANSDHGHENVPSKVPEDQHTMPTSQDGAKAMLGRLKEMRYSVLLK